MFDPSDLQTILGLAKRIKALTTLVEATGKLAKSVKASLPKNTWLMVRIALQTLGRGLVSQMKFPQPYPPAEKAAKVMFAAIFYTLMLKCLGLFALLFLLAFSGDVIFWKCIAAVAIASLLVMMLRWCFVRAENLRLELKETSLVLW